ncbi:hypothetical protein BT96DRAFT_936887 [Gymnopus androsaceus JB14]|uniref:RNase H type-1 domain-containing protein n=1 Tax=Gymnopus androsaceus JB14 TaxID=1447944 RepID=A0A6A4HXT3_9AGAR|nr:hypothetical protein BT96DRAFT_936887 [Gymnopus androsaceus JB14]
MNTYNLNPKKMEKRQAVRKHADWESEIRIQQWEGKEDALKQIEEDDAEHQLFTDGSGIEGMVGSAAVLYREGVKISSLRMQLGKETEHEVFEGELVGPSLGLELLRKERNVSTVSLWIDNTAAISATGSVASGPLHYLMDHFHSLYSRLKRHHPNLVITVGWVPGHEGVEGNEAADEEAKEAAAHGSSPKQLLPHTFRKSLPMSSSAARKTFAKHLNKTRDDMFCQSPRFTRFQKAAKGEATTVARKFQTITKGLAKPHISVLVHLRTGHCYLYAHLHRIGKIDTPDCPACKREPETVYHFLLQCPAHRRARARLRAEVGSRNMNTEKLLNSKDSLRPLFQFINDTGRFRNTFGTLPPLADDEGEDGTH